MKDYTLTQQYTIIGLNGLESLHSSMAKNAVVRGLPIAKLLESQVLEQGDLQPDALQTELKNRIREIKKMGNKEAKVLEHEMAEFLIADGVMEIIPDILACDMNYETAGVAIKSYRSEEEVYRGITEGIRAEILEGGPVTEECLCLLWLFRENGCLHDIFTVEEQRRLEERVLEISLKNPIYHAIWQEEFHSVLGNFAVSYLKAKKNLFKNPYLEGINLVYPYLDRRQAIFIDFVLLGTGAADRRQAVLSYISERGHYVQEVQNGSETLLKIDNSYYSIFPLTRAYGKVPIQGAYIVPVYR